MIAGGLTLIFGLMGVLNFVHGSLTMFGAYLGGLVLVLAVGQATGPLARVAYFFVAVVVIFGALNPAIGQLTGDTAEGLFGLLSLSAPEVSYYMVGAVALLAYLAMQRLLHSPFGRVMIAVRENEARERAVGYDTFPALGERPNAKAGALSGGQQQMLAIARGLVGDNDLLLVDEPSEGLAPQIVADVAEALAAVAEETTILLVEQNLPLAMDLADRFYLLDNGQVVADGEATRGVTEDEEIRRYLSA